MIKVVLSFLLTIIFLNSVSAKNVDKTYAHAVQRMQKENKRGFVLFTAKWCTSCERLKVNALIPYQNKLHQHYVVYYVDVDVRKTSTKTMAGRGLSF